MDLTDSLRFLCWACPVVEAIGSGVSLRVSDDNTQNPDILVSDNTQLHTGGKYTYFVVTVSLTIEEHKIHHQMVRNEKKQENPRRQHRQHGDQTAKSW
jgi:hypothetical protein